MADDQATAQVDMVFEEPTLAGAIANVEAKYGISVRVIEEFGPGGGNPFIELQGTREQVEHALRDGWSFDDDDIKDYFF